MTNILEVKNVFYTPGSSPVSHIHKDMTLKNLNFILLKGDILGIAGESGSGKTSLAKLIAGISKQNSGEIMINKAEEWSRIKASPVQMLFQNNGEILNPFRKIYDLISEAVLIRNRSKKNVHDEIEKVFSYVNFPPELWYKKGFQLSGGEQQRAALARTLALMPELLILDEPFSAQDPESQLLLAQLLRKINNDFNISMICISHNLKVLKKVCGKILIMYSGEIVEHGDCKEIFSNPSHPYTQYLLKAENYDLSYEELKYIPT